jgi:hypothetical protein
MNGELRLNGHLPECTCEECNPFDANSEAHFIIHYMLPKDRPFTVQEVQTVLNKNGINFDEQKTESPIKATP